MTEIKLKEISKTIRVLTIYEKLIKDKHVNKSSLAKLFEVDNRTIQRDFSEIKDYLSNNIETLGSRELCYNSLNGNHYLNHGEDFLNKKDILAIIKILLESRAFSKCELNHLVNSLLNMVNKGQRDEIEKIVSNERFNYMPLTHKDPLLNKIWDLSEIIRLQKIVELEYEKTDGGKVIRQIKPLAIVFSEYYFYLLWESDKYKDITVYRIDRIKKYKILEKKFSIDNSKRFEDGEFRKRVQFMYSGELNKIKFEFYGDNTEYIMDRLPTAVIKERTYEKTVIEAEVYGEGIIMWLLSQSNKIKLISPEILVEKIRDEVLQMYNMYN